MKNLSFIQVAFFIVLSLITQMLSAQPIQLENQYWNSKVIRPRGEPVIPLFDGWFQNEDKTHTLCFSYFNMNTEESLDIPLGENNFLSDERFDAMLPTHFDPLPPRYRHKFCVFTVTVPEDFSVNEKIYWNLTSANEPLRVPGHIRPAFVLDEPVSGGRGNIAPLVRLAAGREGVRGRKGIVSDPIQAAAGQTVNLTVFIEHPDEEVWVNWTKHSGPGNAFFAGEQQLEEIITSRDGESTVAVTFERSGQYIVRMQTIDNVAAFEFYCCHTNAYFYVNVSE